MNMSSVGFVVSLAILVNQAFATPAPDGKAITYEPYTYDTSYEESITKNEEKLIILEQKVDDIKKDITFLQGTFEAQMLKLNSLLANLSTPKPTSDTQASQLIPKEQYTPEPEKENINTTASSDEEAYKNAYKLIVSKDYANAAVSFKHFVKNYPNSDYQSNSHYWLGELYLKDKKYSKADFHFGVVINKFPNTTKVASAMLKRAYALVGMNNITDAKNQLVLITQNYPDTSIAVIAKKKLARIQT